MRATMLSVPATRGLSVAEAALRYAEAGWTVLPVAAGSHDPESLLGPQWSEESSSDPEVITRWFEEWPDASLAVDLEPSAAVAFAIHDTAPVLTDDLLVVWNDGFPLRHQRSPRGSWHVFALQEGVTLPSGEYGPLEGFGEVLCRGKVAVVEPAPRGPRGPMPVWTAGSLPPLPDGVLAGLVEASKPTTRAQGSSVGVPAKVEVRGGGLERLSVQNAGSSWAPRDLTRVLEGRIEPPKASLMCRVDGVGLLYPGMVHTFFGEPESGKSLLLQWACVEVICDREEVLYIDLESDEVSIASRLLSLGASTKHIKEKFTYVRPEDDLSSDHDARMWHQLLDRPFALAVIDGVTEGLDLFGFKSSDNDNVARWMRTIPRRLAQRTGAAVALVDHVTKSREGRGRYPVGAQAKLSAITGAAYSVDMAGPLVAGGQAEIAIRVVKDRPGGVRRHAAAGMDRSPVIAWARITSERASHEGESLIVELEPPQNNGSGPNSRLKADEALDQHILEVVAATPDLSQAKLLDKIGGNRPAATARLNALEAEGRLRTEPGARKAKRYFVA